MDATAHAQLSAKERHLNNRGFVVDTLGYIGDLFIEPVPISGAARSIPQNALHGRVLEVRMPLMQVWTMRRVKQWYTFAIKHAKIYNNPEKHFEAYLYTLTAGSSSIDPDLLTFLRRSYNLWCKVWLDAARNDFSVALSAYKQYPPRDLVEAMNVMQMHVDAGWDRLLFISHVYSFISLCPALARKGDMLAIIHGVDTPCVLRRSRNGRFRFIGQCYVHCLMHGEARDVINHPEVVQFELV